VNIQAAHIQGAFAWLMHIQNLIELKAEVPRAQRGAMIGAGATTQSDPIGGWACSRRPPLL